MYEFLLTFRGLRVIAHWAYSQTEATDGLTWIRVDNLLPLSAAQRESLQIPI